jgi:outer membrane murein-binding lipoprotein Lpp
MKTNRMIVIALATLLLAGCRPGRMVTEKRRMESDSTAVWI